MDKYEEALAKARAGKSLEEIFPEMKESEDEKFLKYILVVCKECVDANDRGLELSMSTTKKLLSYLEKQKEQKPIARENDFVSKPKTSREILKHYLVWAENSEEDCPYTWKELANAIKDGITALEQKPSECIPDSVKFEEGFKTGRALGFREGVESAKTAEWSEEDKDYYDTIVSKLEVIGDDSGLSNNQIEFLREHCPLHCFEWSEEDEEMFERFLGWLQGTMGEKTYSSWLKSLRKRFSLEQKQEWSEEYREEDLRTRFAFYTYKNEEDDTTLYLSNVFVEEASRNKGFGTKILAAAEKVAETFGMSSICLKVKQDSPANAWYRKNGYGYVSFEGDYDWLEKNLEYMKPNKQEWSEDDERLLDFWLDVIDRNDWRMDEYFCKASREFINRLKSLRHQPKAELTLLDENIIEAAVAFVEQNDHFNCWRGIDKHTVIKALRSIKPHWKPSEEQMKALEYFIRSWGESGTMSPQNPILCAANSLLIDLQKLL